MENDLFQRAEANQRRAWRVLEQYNIQAAWESIGAQVHLVGSLAMGLLMNHRDIDFHVYTPELNVAESFRAIAKLASQPGVEQVTYLNLAETEECCLEWHAWCRDEDGERWQVDMIHILQGSLYDGFFEETARRIQEVLTPETRQTILMLKDVTPLSEKVPGIVFYQAVLQGGVRSEAEFAAWRTMHPMEGIVTWQP